MVEVPRRLTPTPEERLRTVVSTVAAGSDEGSTLFARRVNDQAHVRAQVRSVVPPPGGLAFIYGNPDDRMQLALNGGSVAPGAFSPVTSTGGLQFNGGLVYAEDNGFGGWRMTRAGLYLCATTMDLTGTAGDVVLMDDSFSQVMTGSLITVGHQRGLTLPFDVGDPVPVPYIRNVSANSVTIAGCELNMYPIF